jgi:hypothetical protein
VPIESIEADKTQLVYNLDVAENRDFFVGSQGLLVHDFSFVLPVPHVFDHESELDTPAHTDSSARSNSTGKSAKDPRP